MLTGDGAVTVVIVVEDLAPSHFESRYAMFINTAAAALYH